MKPMLARTYGPKYKKFPCYLQPKLNGVRALGQFQTNDFFVMQSRGEKLWLYPFFKHVAEELESIKKKLGNVILDGEFYFHTWKLQRINKAMGVTATVRGPNEDTPHIQFHVFDVVDPHRKFSDRFFDVMNLLLDAGLPHIIPVRAAFLGDSTEMEQHFHFWTKEGYEGVMLRPDGPYEFGETAHGTQKRSEYLWKYKAWLDEEFICTGVTAGEGKADIGIGALELQPLTGEHWKEPAKVGTGFDDLERVEFMQNPPIGKIIRVKHIGPTEEGKPFNPSFIAVLS